VICLPEHHRQTDKQTDDILLHAVLCVALHFENSLYAVCVSVCLLVLLGHCCCSSRYRSCSSDMPSITYVNVFGCFCSWFTGLAWPVTGNVMCFKEDAKACNAAVSKLYAG